jgi:hypothetical protein
VPGERHVAQKVPVVRDHFRADRQGAFAAAPGGQLQRRAAANPLGDEDQRYFNVLLSGDHAINGFRNQDIRQRLAETSLLRACGKDRYKQSAKVTRLLKLERTREAEQRMRVFLAANPDDKHAYRYADTGLDLGEQRERAAPYQRFFDVPSEPCV